MPMQTVDFCCCGCSLRGGTLALFFTALVMDTVWFLMGGPFSHIVVFLLFVISVSFNVAGLIAIYKEKPALLIPTMIQQIISVVLLIILGMAMIFRGTEILTHYTEIVNDKTPAYVYGFSTGIVIFVILTVLSFAFASLQYYFFVVVFSYYKKANEELNLKIRA